MKSKYFCFFSAMVCAMMLLVASCEKMVLSGKDKGAATDEDANVILRVSSFGQVPFTAKTRADVGDVCTRLNFIVYNQAGERIRQEAQTVEDDGFGQASFYLAQGHYFLVVLAHSSGGNPTSTNARKIAFTNSTGYTDTFMYADSLIVSDQEVVRTLNLKRIVAKVRFVFDDAIPGKTERIRFYYTGGSGTLDAANDGWGSVNSKQTQFYDVSRTEKNFEIYTIPHGNSDSLNVTVNTYQGADDDLHILSEREIQRIPVLRNHITTCYGSLFSPVYQMRFTITVDDEWNDSIDFNF